MPTSGNWVPLAPAGTGFGSGIDTSGPGFTSADQTGQPFVDSKSIPRYGSVNLTYGSLNYTYGSTTLLPQDYPILGSDFATINPSTGGFGTPVDFT